MNDPAEFSGGIPEPTAEEMAQLRAEARRVLASPPGPDEYDQLVTRLGVLAETGGEWNCTTPAPENQQVAS